ncbi:MAG: VWA domain-containing protein [Polyangiaceae bacterium]|nr:VWA domain-containing protein [Polyangiaceae bacterium]
MRYQRGVSVSRAAFSRSSVHITRRAAWLFPIALTIAACSAGNKTATGGGGGDAGSGNTGAAGSATTGTNQGAAGPGGFGGAPATTSTGGIEACAGISSEAQAGLQPADIIIAVDTSGSMDQEIEQVQANLNNFASIITNSGIDAHVVMIADSSMCIPAPLGTGQCGGFDTNLPTYRHVVQTVSSTDALQVILDTYDQWKDSLRSGATKTIAVVSDDNSTLSAVNFFNQLLAKDPTFTGFKFDAIVSLIDPSTIEFTCINCAFQGMFSCNNCQEKCCDKMLGCTPLPAEKGQVYIDLAQQTGGILGDLCIQDFGPVFQDMATGIVQAAQLSCEYDIPPPPEGETLDPALVNVNYTPAGQAKKPIFYVNSPADCGNLGGWYYDNPGAPTKIIMCPGTCDILKADTMGKIEVLFGCETEIKPPE